jgi:DNA-directed RNA polymerase subunit L
MGNEVSNIKFADDLLKKDSEFALIVLKLHGEALEYLDESIKDNKEIVLEAVKNNYTAFEYCSESLRKDEDFICEAYKLNHNIMHFIDDKTIMQSKRLQDLNIDNKSREDDEDDLPF